MGTEYFSSDYQRARSRFLQAAHSVDAEIFTYPIDSPDEDDLTLDVAVVGGDTSRALLITSGVHGVEGFFGSAVQLAVLQQQAEMLAEQSIKLVLVHAVNPYGFSRLRRFNEDNVDLNRNFLFDGEQYAGAPAGYHPLNHFLNPPTPPSFEFFRMMALWNICRYGYSALKESIAGGQYDYPAGLFYGGARACQSSVILQQQVSGWVGQSEKIFHLDFHTGLGPYSQYKLLLSDEEKSANYSWFVDTFGIHAVEPLAAPGGTAYTVSGHFGSWMRQHFQHRDIRFAGAEFGTYDVIRVLAAIRAENRAYHYSAPASGSSDAASKELLECFCPADTKWRETVMSSALDIVRRGSSAL